MVSVNQNHKKPVILIVEDDPVLQKMYTEKFIFEGFFVLNARDGIEALEISAKNNLDVILLDIMLPRMSGTDFLIKYRKDYKYKNTPVLVLTNLDDNEEKQKLFSLGVKYYLIKAMYTPDQVVKIIKEILNSQTRC
ncbi:MAG: response regulator [Patescibacteria group bacterium]|nr:response regulator [Patescibacteria group bacterium]